MSGLLSIPIEAGATRRLTFTVTVDGEPLDFTGATVTFHSSRHTKALSVAGNVLTLALTAAETRTMSYSRYVIEATFPSGDVLRLLTGALIVSPEVAA